MPEYTMPGVDIEEVASGPPRIEGVATSVCLFAGPTLTAPEPTGGEPSCSAVESMVEFEQRFGGLDDIQTALGPRCNYVAHATRAFFENGGRRLYIVRVAADASAADYAAALEQTSAFDDVSVIAAPGSSALLEAAEAQEVLLRHVQARHDGRRRFVVLDAPPYATNEQALTARRSADSMDAAFYYPWVLSENPLAPGDPTQPVELLLPPSGFVCGIYARVDAARGVWKAPANEPLIGARGLERILATSDQDVLNAAGVNCLRIFPNCGPVLWGARTMSADAQWKYVNMRRYVSYLEQSIFRGLQWVAFEPNGEKLWSAAQRAVFNFLIDNWRSGALMGQSPDEAFFVRCDRTTMTQEDIDAGRLIALIGVAPLKPAEFVIFRIGQWTLTGDSQPRTCG